GGAVEHVDDEAVGLAGEEEGNAHQEHDEVHEGLGEAQVHDLVKHGLVDGGGELDELVDLGGREVIDGFFLEVQVELVRAHGPAGIDHDVVVVELTGGALA